MTRLLIVGLLVAGLAGCGAKAEKLGQLSGTVKFKGQPVPAGYITFQSERGGVRSAKIENGQYDTAKSQTPGVFPGPSTVRITGFDGKKLPYYTDGKQIFNPYEAKATLTDGVATMDFEVPASAATNLKVEPTADIP